MLFNLHIGVNLLLAMRRHQNYEYKKHKRPIITQLALTTITLGVFVYSICLRPLLDYGCQFEELKFNLSPDQDSKFCREKTQVTLSQLIEKNELPLFIFLEPIMFELPFIFYLAYTTWNRPHDCF
jgi:hypothetical protein